MREGNINQNLSNKNDQFKLETRKTTYISTNLKVGKPNNISMKIRINKLGKRIPPNHIRKREPKAGKKRISNLVSFSKNME